MVWTGNKYRHELARKGIKTKFFNGIRMRDETNINPLKISLALHTEESFEKYMKSVENLYYMFMQYKNIEEIEEYRNYLIEKIRSKMIVGKPEDYITILKSWDKKDLDSNNKIQMQTMGCRISELYEIMNYDKLKAMTESRDD